MIASVILILIIAATIYVIRFFDSSLPDRTANYYEMKAYHGQHSRNRKKWWGLFSFFRI